FGSVHAGVQGVADAANAPAVLVRGREATRWTEHYSAVVWTRGHDVEIWLRGWRDTSNQRGFILRDALWGQVLAERLIGITGEPEAVKEDGHLPCHRDDGPFLEVLSDRGR